MRPTERTLGLLRDLGYWPGIVERWVPNPGSPGGGKRRDLYQIIDIIAIKPSETLGVQSCGQDVSGHVKKLVELEGNLRAWLAGDIRTFWLIGWRPLADYKKNGERAMRDRWQPRIIEYRFVSGEIVSDEITLRS